MDEMKRHVRMHIKKKKNHMPITEHTHQKQHSSLNRSFISKKNVFYQWRNKGSKEDFTFI